MIGRPRLLLLLACLALGLTALWAVSGPGSARAAEEALALATLLTRAEPPDAVADEPCQKRSHCGSQTQSPGLLALDTQRLDGPRTVLVTTPASSQRLAGISPAPEPSPPKVMASA